MMPQEPIRTNYSQHYQLGDPIWILHDNTLGYLFLPSTFMSLQCNTLDPVKIMTDKDVTCLISLPQKGNCSTVEVLGLNSLFTNFSVISI